MRSDMDAISKKTTLIADVPNLEGVINFGARDKVIGPLLRLRIKDELGEGASGKVYKLSSDRSEDSYALKVHKKQGLKSELDILKALAGLGLRDNPYIATEIVNEAGLSLGIITTLVMHDFFETVSWMAKKTKGEKVYFEWVLNIMCQFKETIKEIQDKKVCVRDIKPRNIGFKINADGEATPIIIDVGAFVLPGSISGALDTSYCAESYDQLPLGLQSKLCGLIARFPYLGNSANELYLEYYNDAGKLTIIEPFITFPQIQKAICKFSTSIVFLVLAMSVIERRAKRLENPTEAEENLCKAVWHEDWRMKSWAHFESLMNRPVNAKVFTDKKVRMLPSTMRKLDEEITPCFRWKLFRLTGDLKQDQDVVQRANECLGKRVIEHLDTDASVSVGSQKRRKVQDEPVKEKRFCIVS